MGFTGSLKMDSSEARSCALLCAIRIKVAISGNYLLRDVLTSLLMASPTKCIKKKRQTALPADSGGIVLLYY